MKKISIIITIFLFIIISYHFVKAQDSLINKKNIYNNNQLNSQENALSFDGIDDYVEIQHNNLQISDNFTVELWAKSETEYWNSTGSLISFRNVFIMHPVVNTKIIQFVVFDDKSLYNVEFISNIDLTQWHHYAATYDGNIIYIYIDGKIVSKGKKRRTEKPTDKIGDLYIGCDSKIKGRYFNGSIDEVRIWNYVRTQKNIERTLHLELTGNEKGLIAYYNFNQGLASQINSNDTTLKDFTGKNNGKLFNFSLAGDTSNWVKSNLIIIGKNKGNDLITNVLSPINIVIILTLILLIFVYFYIKIRRQKKIRLYLEQQVAKKTRELQEENKIKDALISEIHHRVKNNLQTISSLIYFQLKNTPEEENQTGLRSIETRINSMSAIHEMLYSKNDNTVIPLKIFIKDFINSLNAMIENQNQNIEIIYNIEDIEINISQAITLGLMISEIITNSIKYAFNDTEKPKININIYKQNNEVFFLIKDNGCGVEQNILKNKDNSLGFKLISIFARQLNAKMNIENNNGLEFQFNFKVN